MNRGLPPDPELDDLFDEHPSLEPFANLLRASRLKDPPLDPAFRSALRRRVMEEAWTRGEPRPSFLASLFRGPGLAWAGASMAAVLLAIFVVQVTNQATPTTQVNYLSAYPTGSVMADQPITLTFSQAMDHQSVEQAIHIEPATQVRYNWQGNQLTIVPNTSSLAPNTQYHVTIAPTATTAAGKPIDKPIAVTFNTQPPTSPAPAPNASPSPSIGLAGEKLLQPGVVTIVGWSADGGTLFYIGRNGELASSSADGKQPTTIVRDAVRSASLSPSGAQLAYVRNGSLAVIGSDGSGIQVLAQVDALDVAWAGSKVVYAVASEPVPTPGSPSPSPAPTASVSPSPSPRPSPSASPSPASSPTPGPAGSPVAGPSPSAPASPPPALQAVVVPALATNLSFAPDGRHLVYNLGASTLLTDGSATTAWAQAAGSTVAWSPDSARVVFTADGILYSATPDGPRRQLVPLAAVGMAASPAPGLSWSSTDQVLLGTASALATVRADGTAPTSVRNGDYGHPVWAPAATRFAFFRAGDLWLAELSSAGGASTALADSAKVVDAFMLARLAGDVATAETLLDAGGRQAYASGNPALVVASDPRLRRYYVVSAQLLPGADAGVQYVVRLVLARGTAEVFSYDETLVLQRRASGLLMIHAASAGPRVAVGHGPSVVSTSVKGRLVLVSFDSDLAPETVGGALKVTDPAGRAVPFKFDYANRLLTVALPELAPVKGYRLAVATSLQDIDHQALAAEFDFEFVASPVIASPIPPG